MDIDKVLINRMRIGTHQSNSSSPQKCPYVSSKDSVGLYGINRKALSDYRLKLPTLDYILHAVVD